MGRVLSPFSKVIRPQRIELAPKEPFGGSLKEVIESPVTDLAVAGISRIADELDYRDRLNAEKQKVAAADIEERKAQAAFSALQEQQTARVAAMAAAEERAAQIAAAGEAQMRAMERADLAGIQQGEAIDAMSGTVAGILGGSPEDGRQAIAAMGDVAGTVGAGLPRAAIPQQSEWARTMAAINEDPVAFEAAMEARQRAVSPPPTPEQAFYAGLAQAQDPGAYYAAWQAKQKPGYDPTIAGGEGQYRVTPPLDVTGQAPPIPEEVTAEQLAAARERMATAEKASAIPMAFVPRTLADYRFQVRELERALVGAETQEEKAAIIDQLRNTMETARGAVDVQPDGLIEAVTGVAGKKAQKVAFEGMSTGEKEFLKQMYDASKEKRDAAREGRAVAKEGRAVAKEAHEVEMRPLRVKQIKAQVKKLKKKARGSRRAGKVDDAIGYALIAATAGNIDDYKGKTGAFSDDAIQKDAGMSLSPEETESRRQQKWRSITTAPDGRSMSDADHTNLSAKAGALGFNKNVVSEARSTQGKMHSRVAASVRGEERKDAVEKRVRQKMADRGLPPSLETRQIRIAGDRAYWKAKEDGNSDEVANLLALDAEDDEIEALLESIKALLESLPPGTADAIEDGAGRPARADEYVITEIMEQP